MISLKMNALNVLQDQPGIKNENFCKKSEEKFGV